jgi:hypothetical protein
MASALPPEVLATIAQRRLGIQSQHDTALQQAGSQYNQNLSNLTDYSNDTAKRINDQFAGQGMFNSSVRVDEQGRLQKNIGQRQGYLGTQYGQQQSGIESQYQNALNALSDYQNQAQTEATRNDLQQQQIAAQNAASAAQQQYAAGGGGAQNPVTAAPAAPIENQPSLADIQNWYKNLYSDQLLANPFDTNIRNVLQFVGLDPNVVYDEAKQKATGNYQAAVSTGGSKAY